MDYKENLFSSSQETFGNDKGNRDKLLSGIGKIPGDGYWVSENCFPMNMRNICLSVLESAETGTILHILG